MQKGIFTRRVGTDEPENRIGFRCCNVGYINGIDSLTPTATYGIHYNHIDRQFAHQALGDEDRRVHLIDTVEFYTSDAADMYW